MTDPFLPKVSTWMTLREAMGLVKGAPADAVTDCKSLYDGDPFDTEHRIIPVDLFDEPIVCTSKTRWGKDYL